MAKDKPKKTRGLTTDEAIDRLFGKHASQRLRAAVARLDADATGGKRKKKEKKKKKKGKK
jgi:hypothetical protein